MFPAGLRAMNHFVAHTVRGRLLFHTWSEGLHLLNQLMQRTPGRCAVVVMPDHFHVVARECERAGAMRCHARWLNGQHDRSGALFLPAPPAEAVARDKVRRVERYAWLNPARARLVRDPLSWPLSNYRQRVGLALGSPVEPERAERLHRYVSSDPSCDVGGTPLPNGHSRELLDVFAAVAWLNRCALTDLRVRGEARTVAAGVAKVCTDSSHREIGAALGLSMRSVLRSVASPDAVALVTRLAGDPRVRALAAGRIRDPEWIRWTTSWVKRQ